MPGSYRGLYAPAKKDTIGPVRFFTGEPIKSRASIAHILSEDAIRMLTVLIYKDADVRSIYERSVSTLMGLMNESEDAGYNPGIFCCGNCTSAYWRNLLVLKRPDLDRRLERGLAHLKAQRLGNGRWRKYPFFQTVLVLTEMGERARPELAYTRPVLERILKRKASGDVKFLRRRSKLAERVLAMV
ncbi:MAG: hypothetical protein O3B73_01675 [bacterium]|nr:hypothetical protein [bacterium]